MRMEAGPEGFPEKARKAASKTARFGACLHKSSADHVLFLGARAAQAYGGERPQRIGEGSSFLQRTMSAALRRGEERNLDLMIRQYRQPCFSWRTGVCMPIVECGRTALQAFVRQSPAAAEALATDEGFALERRIVLPALPRIARPDGALEITAELFGSSPGAGSRSSPSGAPRILPHAAPHLSRIAGPAGSILKMKLFGRAASVIWASLAAAKDPMRLSASSFDLSASDAFISRKALKGLCFLGGIDALSRDVPEARLGGEF